MIESHAPAAVGQTYSRSQDVSGARTECLHASQLVCGYERPVVGPVDLAIEPGRFVLIEGPNGVGKSTLLKTLVGLLPPISGSYRWSAPSEAIRFVPQIRTLDPILPATVGDVVATGAQNGSGWRGLRFAAGQSEVIRALERVGMARMRGKLFRQLSEGQKQLVLLARALMGQPRVVLLDEPAASMDPQREQQALDLLVGMQRERELTVFMVAHGSPTARQCSDMQVQIASDGTVQQAS
jgi:ABC-type Mn2+/Zn2+ transport system ATPase subunit